ncbi:MAG: DUF3788 domain-containing protein [Gemmatimonadota bacterium]|nr:MAG: DUF3788 domain-containing protein [Gemmatimonadota bacterium]
MAISAFDDKSAPPKADQLATALGRARRLWEDLVTALASQHPPLTETWKFGGKQWGWALQLKQRKRTVVYLTPCRGHLMAGFALGEKAVNAAHRSDLPSSVLAVIDSAKKYAEGRAVRLEVRTKKDAAAVQQLAAIKMAN